MGISLSYWEKLHFYQYDFIVIGSGIVGLNAAITLKQKHKKSTVAILERGFLPSGASTKNAGFACFGSISELIEQEKISGIDGLHQLIERRWEGLLNLRKLIGDDNLDFQNLGGYELFKPEESNLAQKSVFKIEHYNLLVQDIIKNKEVYKLANKKIKSFGLNNIETLIENRFEAQIDIGKMMQALLQKAQSLGIVVLNNCSVNKIETNSNEIELITNQGNFSCNKLLLTTNAFTKQLLPDLDIVPGRGQVLITKPINNLKLKGTFHYNKGYYYFRNIHNRILLGGGRNLDFKAEETTEFGETELVQQTLENLMKEIILPGVDFEIEQRWSGIMAFGSQIYPIIEQVKPNVFCAVRCSGMGIAMGTLTGQDLAYLVEKSI